MSGFLADKSALARMHQEPVAEAVIRLADQGIVSVCAVTELEVLFSARNAEHRRLNKEDLASSFGWVPMRDDVWKKAEEIQKALTDTARHRCASVPDLLIAATALAQGLTVLHYDRDFDTIAEVTGQPTEWVVPPGTV